MLFRRLSIATASLAVAVTTLVSVAYAAPVTREATITLNSGTCETDIFLDITSTLPDGEISYIMSPDGTIVSWGRAGSGKPFTGWEHIAGPYMGGNYSFVYTNGSPIGRGTTNAQSLVTVHSTFTLDGILGENCNFPEPTPPPPTPSNAGPDSFFEARNSIIGNSVRPTNQRISRLNGAQSSSTPTGGDVLNYVSNFAATGNLPVSASLSAISAAADQQGTRSNPFDVWIEGTFSLLETSAGNGRASSAAIGADYLVNSDLLIGGYVSIDRLDHFETGSNTLSGLGWLAGPYLTARLSDQLYIDVTSGLGTANNKSKGSSGEDEFSSSRAYFNASLQGSFGEEAIRFTPRLGLNYAGEWSAAYVDHKGTTIAAASSSSSNVYAGPGITFTDAGADLTRSLTLRADANTSLGQSSQFSAALEAAVEFNFANGLGLSARTNWSGLGTSDKTLNVSVKASAGF
jgi:hypothetical protein